MTERQKMIRALTRYANEIARLSLAAREAQKVMALMGRTFGLRRARVDPFASRRVATRSPR